MPATDPPKPGTVQPKPCLEVGFLKRFEEFAETQACDYLCLLGDLTQSGQPDEVQHAAGVIERLRKALGVPRTRVIVVPGNHDVDRVVSWLPDRTGFRHEQRYDPVRQKRWGFPRLTRRAGPRAWDFTREPYFSVWRDSRLQVLSYNSAWGESKDTAIQHGSVSPQHLAALKEWLSANPLDERLRIFAVHHHPIPYSNPYLDRPDFSMMEGVTPDLIRYLHEQQCDAILHGHKHFPFFNYNYSVGHPIPILCAGSFSAPPDTRFAARTLNSFHILCVEEERSGLPIRGAVLSWTYHMEEGWVPSSAVSGLASREPFGVHMARHEARDLMSRLIHAGLMIRDPVGWYDLVAADGRLAYLERSLVSSVVEEIKKRDGYACWRNDADPDDFRIGRASPEHR